MKSADSKLICDLEKKVSENYRLQLLLREVTEKQHQEMSRAISLMEKNIMLRNKVHEAKKQACYLKLLNKSKLRELISRGAVGEVLARMTHVRIFVLICACALLVAALPKPVPTPPAEEVAQPKSKCVPIGLYES
ncbi:hypothetical protein ACJJTC_013129 [Scirpophaga incertulas]